MPSLAIVGAQWGDEGKGKIVDFLAGKAKTIARFNGGANAGHTVVVNRKTYKLHLLPSGAIRKNATLILGNGMVLDPEILISEIKLLKKENPTVKIYISDKAHVVMPYHKLLDVGKEKRLKAAKIGTTARGIGPTYMDKARRSEALRVYDLVNGNLQDKLEFILKNKNHELSDFGTKVGNGDLGQLFNDLVMAGKFLKPYVCDTSAMINELLDAGSLLIFEGAQGTLLDIDHGTFPYVTASNATVGGVCTGLGISPKRIDEIIGVFKAYTTRVGEGPFPTELLDKTGNRIREGGKEYGTTTGRPRRCGWLDLPIVPYSARINGFTQLAITKLDVLTGIEKIKVCIGYKKGKVNGQLFTPNIDELVKLKPVYKEFDGWESFPSRAQIRRGGKRALPKNSRKYLKFIEDYLSVPIKIISYGPDRKDTISS